MIKYICYIFLLIPILVFAQNYNSELSKHSSNPDSKVTMLPDSILRIEYSRMGITKHLDISDQKIHIASLDDDDMQLIDLINIDDSLYTFRFDSVKTYPIGGFLGYPMVIGDINQNGKLDLAGSYRVEAIQDLNRAAIIELQYNGGFSLEILYDDTLTKPLSITDLDNDGLDELNIRRHHYFYNFEQRVPNSYPDSLNIIHEMWQRYSNPSSETFTDMDNDDIIDVIYIGADTLDPYGQKVYVAEYVPSTNSFIKRFSNQPKDRRTSGISFGDFDNDGHKEFAVGAIQGNVYVYENKGPDTYQMVYHDSLPTPNAYLNCSTNDMDNNGKDEFFIAGSSYYWGVSGTWVFWYEADGDDNYIKPRSFFLTGTGVLGTTEMYSYDVNNDGKLDLVFGFANLVAILIWNEPEEEFDLYYFKIIDQGYTEIQSVNIYDADEDGAPDLFISIRNSHTEPRIRSHYYKSNLLTGIDNPIPAPITTITLSQNYPNPFNPNTYISFNMPMSKHVLLEIYNTLGQKIITLVDNYLSAGDHIIEFDGRQLTSGVYLYRIQTSDHSAVKKMIYLK